MADITNAAAAGAAQAAETAENALAEAGSLPLDGTHLIMFGQIDIETFRSQAAL